MHILTILAGGVSLPLDIPAREAIVWDRRTTPLAMRSVPRYLEEHLGEIRAELVRWAYDAGRAEVSGREVQDWLKGGDRLSLWWCSLLFEQHPKVMPDLYLALKLRALERMIESMAEDGGESYTAIHCIGGDDRLARALESFCIATGRLFVRPPATSFPRRRESSQNILGTHTIASNTLQKLSGVYYQLPAPLKALVRGVAWLWQKRRLPRIKEPCPASDYGTIATYFPNIDTKEAAQGRFRSRYWESLHDALEAASARVHWLFIAFPSPQYTFAQCLELRDVFRTQGRDTYHYLEEFLGIAHIWRAVLRYARLLWASVRIEAAVRPLFCFAGSRMNLWEYLGPYYADSFRGWRALERCLHREAMLAWTEWAGPQRWTLFPMENCPWERMLTEAVHTSGHGPVYGVQHSVVRPADFRFFDDTRTFDTPDCVIFQPDTILANGQGSLTAFRNAGVPESRLGLAEALRYMYLATGGQTPPLHCHCEERVARRGNPFFEPAPPRMLIVTSFFADECKAHVRALCEWLRTEHGFEVALKPHPYLDVTPYFAEADALDVMPPVLTQPVGALLTPGTVVWASNSTTVALEAALCGLYVLVQTPEDDVDLSPLPSTALMRSGVRVSSAAEVSAALREYTARETEGVQETVQGASLSPEYLLLDPALPRLRQLLGL